MPRPKRQVHSTAAKKADASRPQHALRITLSGLFLSTLSACPSTSLYRTADPVPQGQWRMGGALGPGVMSDREQGTRFLTAQAELTARRGITANLDVGAKLYLAGAQLEATWRVFHRHWSIALAPSVGGLQTPQSPVIGQSIHLFSQLATIASRPLSPTWTLSLGPSLGWGFF